MSEPSRPEGAAREGVISLRVQRLQQLFNSLDPSPFRERDLNADAETFIVDWARELPRAAPLAVVVRLPAEEAERARAMNLPEAFANYFDYRATGARREKRELFRMGWRYLGVGAAVLFACLGALQAVRAGALGHGALAGLLEESLLIAGWVANWKPIQLFLYDWWPIQRRIRLYLRLAAACVFIEADPPAGGPA